MNNNVQNELYASLELQITMAQDYSEWLKQETKRNNELLESHSTALSRLNGLMVQSPSEDGKIDSGRGEELPEGLKREDAPKWAYMLAQIVKRDLSTYYLWCDTHRYMYVDTKDTYPFQDTYKHKSVDELEIIATRPKGV